MEQGKESQDRVTSRNSLTCRIKTTVKFLQVGKRMRLARGTAVAQGAGCQVKDQNFTGTGGGSWRQVTYQAGGSDNVYSQNLRE